ncbi:unnamed protein product [Allacma fusca]|uniref:Carboxylic ester hydrolase n=1 Tax=Allacma fusca TaxID=39272 RepID=A0A8J2LA64_9HEXA|nr:unnamed protein product [Allacma fusca]
MVVGLLTFTAIQLTVKSNNRAGNLKLASPQDFTILGHDFENNTIELLKEAEPFANRRRIPLVRIPSQGRLRGTILKSRRGRDYYAFYKVPYAAPPVGELRFELPQTPKRWFGVRDATKPGPQCIQRSKYEPVPTPAGEEDCLFINIYTPQLPSDATNNKQTNFPVLVYFHGGGGPFGNGTRYGAKYFMDEDAVLVTVEFRIGILGYLSTGTPDYPGNIAAKDQVFSLKWVQKNIEKFGGDPKRVMIFGNSGGGFIVHSLLLSHMTTGLFSSGVLQSGNCILNLAYTKDSTALAKQLAQEVGCEEKSLVECLRKIDAKDLVLTKSQEMALVFVKEPIPADGDISNTFFTDSPWNLIQQGQIKNVPIIVGAVSQESLGGVSYDYLVNETATKEINMHFEEMLPSIMGLQSYNQSEIHTMAKKFRELYFEDKPINNDTRVELLQLNSDSFVHSLRISALEHSKKTQQPVYLYWLTKEPARTYAEKYTQTFPPPYGASHADELQYFFLYDGYPEITTDSPWYNYSKTLVKMWVDFAATGKPISPTDEWKPIDPADNGMKWFELGDNFREVKPVTKRMLLWDEYIPELYWT